MSAQIGIGSTVWLYEENRRVHAKGSGRTGGPIFRGHWAEYKITGETSRSWIVGVDGWEKCKLPKKLAPAVNEYAPCFSAEELDRRCFVAERHKLMQHIGNIRDYDTLKAIADASNYQPKP